MRLLYWLNTVGALVCILLKYMVGWLIMGRDCTRCTYSHKDWGKDYRCMLDTPTHKECVCSITYKHFNREIKR